MHYQREVMLENLCHEALSVHSYQDTVKTVAQEIVPCIRKEENLISKWDQKWDLHKQEMNQLAQRGYLELKRNWSSIKQDIRDNRITNPYIVSRIHSIDVSLSAKRDDIDVEKAIAEIEVILVNLLAFDYDEIVKKYAKITLSGTLMCCPITGKWSCKSIVEYKFYLQLRKRRRLGGWFSPHATIKDDWIAWKFLEYLAWCYNTSESFFDESTQSNHPLIREHWNEMQDIKKGVITPRWFSKDKVTASLKLICDTVYSNKILSYEVPYRIIISLEPNHGHPYLMLKVWRDEIGMGQATYVIHQFRKKTAEYKLISYLLKNKGVHVSIKKFGCRDIRRSLGRLKLNNVIGEIIFSYSEENCMSLQSDSIRIKESVNITKGKAYELAAYIDSLESLAVVPY